MGNIQFQLCGYLRWENSQIIFEKLNRTLAMNSSTFNLFHAFVFSIFVSLITSDFFAFKQKPLTKKKKKKKTSVSFILFFKSCIIQMFVHQVCMNLLFYNVKIVKPYTLYHTNCLMYNQRAFPLLIF